MRTGDGKDEGAVASATELRVRTADDLPCGHWMKQQLPAGTSLRPYVEDGAASVLVGTVAAAVENAGLSRAEVARLLGTTKSNVSQLLNGSRNMTVKTLGALLWACGRKVYDLRTIPTADEQLRGANSDAPKNQSPSASLLPLEVERREVEHRGEVNALLWRVATLRAALQEAQRALQILASPTHMAPEGQSDAAARHEFAANANRAALDALLEGK